MLAFVCLLLCTISTPIVKGIYLFRVSTTSTGASTDEVSFGVFGGCGTTANFRSVACNTTTTWGLRIDICSTRFQGSQRTSSGTLICTPVELSYEILTREMYRTNSGSYTSRAATLVDHNTTSALIMNPIAAALAGLAMILAPIAALLQGRVIHGVSLISIQKNQISGLIPVYRSLP